MKFFIVFLLLIAAIYAAEDWKKDLCLAGCKALKKDWQQQLCEVGCNQIKSDSDIFGKKFKKFFNKAGKVAKTVGKEYIKNKYGIPLSDSDKKKKKGFWNKIKKGAKDLWKKNKGKIIDFGKKKASEWIKKKTGLDIELSDEEMIKLMKKISKKRRFPKKFPKKEFRKRLIKKWLKKKLNKEVDVSEADVEFLKGLGKKIKKGLKKAAPVLKKIGKEYIKNKYGIPLSDSETSINTAGLNLIKSFESFQSCKYKDPIGLWTIGYGHLIKSGETFDHCLSVSEAENLLRKDLSTFESCISRNVKVSLNSNQFSALVSFSFNVGCGNFQSSTLLKKLNANDYSSVCSELARWNKAGGKVLPGLTRRREAECNLFRS